MHTCERGYAHMLGLHFTLVHIMMMDSKYIHKYVYILEIKHGLNHNQSTPQYTITFQ